MTATFLSSKLCQQAELWAVSLKSCQRVEKEQHFKETEKKKEIEEGKKKKKRQRRKL